MGGSCGHSRVSQGGDPKKVIVARWTLSREKSGQRIAGYSAHKRIGFFRSVARFGSVWDSKDHSLSLKKLDWLTQQNMDDQEWIKWISRIKFISQMKWKEMKWISRIKFMSQMKWNEMKWISRIKFISQMKWNELVGLNLLVKWNEIKWNEMN
jgi:hypothetical protein